MTEFALTLPLLLLLFVFALDFGRVFLGWVNLNNTVRVAANFAAMNPNAWNAGNPDADAQDEYVRLIEADSAGINCQMPTTLPDPTFPAGQDLGQPAQVGITCEFEFITPFLGSFLGDPLPVSASAAFPIRHGAINGIPVASTTVTSTSTSTTTTGTTTTSTTATTATCTVPDFSANPRNTSQAQSKWSGAGFTTNVIFNPLVPPNYNIGTQSPAAGSVLPCDSTSVTVGP
jgi:Flp pilus assembly protein TadG